MTIYYDRGIARAGATPATFDGDVDIVLNDKGQSVIGIGFSMSQSVHTTDEGVGAAVRLKSSQIPGGEAKWPLGWFANSGPTTNSASKISRNDVLGVEFPTKPNTTWTFDWTSLGGTQTGTIDATVSIVYHDGNVPSDILAAYPGIVNNTKGGDYSIDDAVAVTAETPMPTFIIPDWVKEVVGVKAVVFLDGAVTQSEEITGYIRVDFGISDQTPMNIPLNGGDPGLGTEVEGANLTHIPWMGMHVPLPGRELTVRPFVNLASAITGGAQILLALAWR